MSCYSSGRNGNCNRNLASNNPISNYQKQKIIQNTVRTDSSNYMMNLGALSVYQNPLLLYNNVNWNQQSDRAIPHIQFSVSNGGNPGGNSTKRTLTSLKPGALSPGGIGVDIKHNSYYRYLAKIKGKAPLRREINIIPIIPKQGGKTSKTNIINNCNCIDNNNNDLIVQNTQQLNNVMFDLDASLCQQTCNYNCVPNTTKLVTDYLTSCPTNELIYVL